MCNCLKLPHYYCLCSAVLHTSYVRYMLFWLQLYVHHTCVRMPGYAVQAAHIVTLYASVLGVEVGGWHSLLFSSNMCDGPTTDCSTTNSYANRNMLKFCCRACPVAHLCRMGGGAGEAGNEAQMETMSPAGTYSEHGMMMEAGGATGHHGFGPAPPGYGGYGGSAAGSRPQTAGAASRPRTAGAASRPQTAGAASRPRTAASQRYMPTYEEDEDEGV